MLILCDKCNQTADSKLRKDTDEVYCGNCGQRIETITKFIVEAMRNNKDYVEEQKQSFTFPCKACGERKSALVTLDGKQVVCADCEGEINVSPFMRLTMKNLGLFVERITEEE